MELDKFIENSKQRFDFNSWPRRVGAAAVPKTRGFALDMARCVKDWAFEERQVQGRGYCDYFTNPDNPKQRVMIRVSEYQSHEGALLGMLENLTFSTAPTLPRLDECNVKLGDVGFCGFNKELTSLIFVRHNVLIDIRSIGAEQIPVVALAEQADAQIQASAQ